MAMCRFGILGIIFLFSLLNYAVISSSHSNSNQMQTGVSGKGADGGKPVKSSNGRLKSSPHEFLTAHNKIRADHNETLLKWDKKLARNARRWANKLANDCSMEHNSESPYGENLFWCKKDTWTPAKVVKYWGDEKSNYNPKTNECVNKTICGHYTQIVWKTTLRVGCAHVQCSDKNGYLFVCSYDPPGNYLKEGPFGGRFEKSVVEPEDMKSQSSEAILDGVTGRPRPDQ